MNFSSFLIFSKHSKNKLYIYTCTGSQRLPNESRFVKRVSFLQLRFVSSRVSFWLVSILEQTNLVENHLSSDSLIVTIKNQVVSQKPWVILDVQQLSRWNFLPKKIGGKWLLPTSNLDNPQFVIGCNTE